MHEKVMLTCGVTGDLTTRERHPGLPVTPREIAEIAPSNVALVEKAAQILERLGATPASPREARSMLGLDR